MQTDCPFSSQLLTIGDEGLKAFNMSVVGDTSDYQWKEFQGSVPVSWKLSEASLVFIHQETLQKCWSSHTV